MRETKSGSRSTMTCPGCGEALHAVTAGGISVDVCTGGCGGLWFDRFELQKVDERLESAGESLLDIRQGPRRGSAQPMGARRRFCPRCPNVAMQQSFFSVKRSVTVDHCPDCGGFWLDPGELGTIRAEYATETERRRAAEEYFAELFDGQLAIMRAESQAKLEQARKIARMFRFICPSYYMPGKQKWGAF